MTDPERPRRTAAFRRLLLVALVLGAAGATVPACAQADRWHPYGPPRGAFLDLVAGPAGQLFVAAEESGVYASRDGGQTWAWSGEGMGSQGVRALAADPASGALYAVGDSRVFRSTDAGVSWQTLASDLPFGPPPEEGGDVLVLGSGAPPTLYLARGVRLFRGTRGGTAWQEVLDTPTRIRALLVDPGNPLSVFAGPEAPAGGYPISALWHSADGGSSWSTASASSFDSLPHDPISIPAPATYYGFRQLSAAPTAPAALFAVVGANVLYRSLDGGATWHLTSVPGGAEDIVGSVVVAPGPPAIVYAIFVVPGQAPGPDGRGLFASHDLGTTWERVDRGEEPPGYLHADPATGDLYALSSHGVAHAEAGGTHWRRFLIDDWLCSTPSFPGGGKLRFPRHSASRVYAVANLHLYTSDDGGASWSGRAAALPDDPFRCALLGDLALDPRRDDTLVATTSKGVFRSTDAGATWQALPQDAEGAVAVLANGTILAGDWGLRRSTDGGKTWFQTLGCDVTRGGPEPGSRIVERLLRDPSRPQVVYAEVVEAGGHPNEVDRLVYRSTNGGRTWASLPVDAGAIALDPRSPGTLYALGRAGVWQSVDDGGRWRRIGGFTPEGGGGGDLAVDPADSRVLWAARPDGVWQSRDGGVTWQPRSAGLRGRPAFTLFPDPRHRRLEIDSAGFFAIAAP